MLGNIFKKYSESSKKKKIVITIIENLKIKDNQKKMYLESLEYLDNVWLEKLYLSLQNFVNNIEQKQLEDIQKNNYSTIAGMRKKEAIEKQKEINSFWFLFNNI